MQKDYFFVSDIDGHLYDTRRANWHKKPLRKNFSRTYSRISTVNQLKATLRNGPFAWPGGYPMYLITSDGAALHYECVRDNLRNVYDSIHTKTHDGWKVVAADINYEDNNLYCDHCWKAIESAYGNDKTYTWYDGMGIINLTMTHEQMESVSHQGPCDIDAEILATQLQEQLDLIPQGDKIKVLSEIGAWNEDELNNDHGNNLRIVWIAGCDIRENPNDYKD